ncbi:DUF7119 family protein [Halovivax gelatinilyticus]|uniref:DUF7119 family protein n=1 Tax=Halovivax gelatinilyticus TaxID=2961597 RepID=UPI0020CA3B84|nr:hypothetical protein [Halovivax gelatinilyticus]
MSDRGPGGERHSDQTDDAVDRRSDGTRAVDGSLESSIPTDRESPVGAPVIRGDETITGEHATRAVGFDPGDTESVAEAAETVRAFAAGGLDADHIEMLRGAAACAALVRGVGSYTAAVERAGGDVTVSFVRKWGRVHDLPRSVRLQVARGDLVPSAAKHVARVSGTDRLLLAWAALDGDLTVRQVRRVASAVADGVQIEDALADEGVTLGELRIRLPAEEYLEVRRRASLDGVDPGDVIADSLASRDRNV